MRMRAAIRIQEHGEEEPMSAYKCNRMRPGVPPTPLTAPQTPRSSLVQLLCAFGFRCALALLLVCGICLFVKAQSVEEHEVKAAFVLKLINFVQWPDAGGQHPTLVIGILGTDATSDALERLAFGKSVDGREIVVRRLNTESNFSACQVIFIGASERNQAAALIERIRGSSVLTVGESDGFGQHGGIVNLMLDEGRIHLEVNPNAAQRAHLQISSRLLSLATIVRDGA